MLLLKPRLLHVPSASLMLPQHLPRPSWVCSPAVAPGRFTVWVQTNSPALCQPQVQQGTSTPGPTPPPATAHRSHRSSPNAAAATGPAAARAAPLLPSPAPELPVIAEGSKEGPSHAVTAGRTAVGGTTAGGTAAGRTAAGGTGVVGTPARATRSAAAAADSQAATGAASDEEEDSQPSQLPPTTGKKRR